MNFRCWRATICIVTQPFNEILDNNELNRRIRYALSVDDAEAQRLTSLGGQQMTLEQISGYRMKEGEAEFLACPDAVLLAFLDGIILDRRGPPPEHAQNSRTSADGPDTDGKTVPDGFGDAVNNNLVLKQLRIALSLRSDQVHELISAGGGKIGKSEVGALFRNPQARNYRRCGDQVLRWFLQGLAGRREE